MAIDTETKRRSALGTFVMPLMVAPVPDNVVGAVDREHILGIYAGIAPATAGVLTDDLHIFSTAVIEPNHVSDSGDNVLFKGQTEAQGGAYVGGATDYHAVSSSGVVTYGGAAKITGEKLNTVAKTAAYTATATDDIITCGAGNETFTIDLPAVLNGKVYYIKNVGTGVITVDANTTGSTTIDGSNTQTLNQYECLQVISDASVYWAI